MVKEFRATRKIKTCCGFEDRVSVYQGSRFVTSMTYETFIELFDVRMADQEERTFKVAVIPQGRLVSS